MPPLEAQLRRCLRGRSRSPSIYRVCDRTDREGRMSFAESVSTSSGIWMGAESQDVQSAADSR
jgi:hypothetical protein